MKSVDLTQERHTLAEILALAKRERLLIHSASGEDFVLEPADEFDREVAALGSSKRFMSFLKQRAKEQSDISLQDVRNKRTARRS